ncbi:hypothetical protein PHMEG_00021258 [Phytophthora megakarya]|uniref:PiggyBac transposable element-derived protein domain-containing protein n=1 Tax=Phytophthora megakarya TaxID=4795 RepID=A0A225VPK8_9STRA|nr:hypothetical protein PHMEG_00021258 [Phytophthora megakarya]
MASMNMQSSFHIVAPAKIIKARRDKAESGLFFLFRPEGSKNPTESEFNFYYGLEITMSIRPLRDITEYWSESRFLRKAAFKEPMDRTCFQNIRSALQFHASDDPTLDKLHDLLWHSWTLLNHFQKPFADFAIRT